MSPRRRYLEHVINDQIARQQNQEKDSHDEQKGRRIHPAGKLRSGIAPVDANIDVSIRIGSILCLISCVFQNLFQIGFDGPGAVFQHHIQIPASRHLIRSRRRHVRLLQNLIQAAFRDQDMIGHDRRIILPPAAQDKGLCGLMSVHLKGHSEFRPQAPAPHREAPAHGYPSPPRSFLPPAAVPPPDRSTSSALPSRQNS